MSLSQTADLLKPRRLKKNACIGIISPASTPDPEKLNRGILYLESIGYRTKVGQSCYSKMEYLAGPDSLRAQEINDFFADPKIDAIFCSRGGYGCMHLLPLIDFDIIMKNPKLFSGFSDVTCLEWSFFAKTGLVSISGGMVATDMGPDPVSQTFESQFWEMVESGDFEWKLPPQNSPNKRVSITGHSLPGTLSVAAKLIGTPWMPETEGALFIFEDVDEPIHKTEGYLRHFALSGHLGKSAGFVSGVFSPAEKEGYEEVPQLETVLERVTSENNIPLIGGLPYGHIFDKISLPLGVPISVSLDTEIILRSKGSIYSS